MNIFVTFTASLLLVLAAGAPTSKDDKLVITSDFFSESYVVYSSEHDIINVLVPLNGLNFDDDDDDTSTESDDGNSILFFVEADIDETGNKDYKGLYIFKNNKATKLLENGRDATSDNDETKDVYFAADDGLYKYDAKSNSAKKYGSLKDNFIHLVKENGTDVFFVINDKYEMYKVTDGGNKKELVEGVKDAKQLVMDFSDNIYYYGNDKVVHVINGQGTLKVEGLPENPSYIQLVKPPFVLEESVPVIVDNKAYIVYANGTVELSDFELEVKPTGYAMEAALIQYYGYNKKLYEINVLSIILGEMLSELKEYFEDQVETIQTLATRSRSDLRP